MVACTFILSGLRLFDIRDPYRPKEIAYFNGPAVPEPTAPTQGTGHGANYAMSKPAFVPERGEIWYTDGNHGFSVVRVTNDVWPFGSASSPSDDGSDRPPADPVTAPDASEGSSGSEASDVAAAAARSGTEASGGAETPFTGVQILFLLLIAAVAIGVGAVLLSVRGARRS